MKPLPQHIRVARYLLSNRGRAHSGELHRWAAQHGILNVRARILDLRRAGYNITVSKVPGKPRQTIYHLSGIPPHDLHHYADIRVSVGEILRGTGT